MKCPYRKVKELKIKPSGIIEEEEFKECLYSACPFYDTYVLKLNSKTDCLRARNEIEGSD